MRRNVVSRVVEKDDALLSGYKFQGSRVYPEYKDDRVCFLPLFKTRFLQVDFFFFFLQKRKTYKKFIYKEKKQGNMTALFTATSFPFYLFILTCK